MSSIPSHYPLDYHSGFLTSEESAQLYARIWESADLSEQRIVVNGTEYSSGVGKVIFLDEATLASGKVSPHEGRLQVWLPELRALQDRLEAFLQRRFGVCVCIYYCDGTRHADYHRDFPAFGDLAKIASISLGEPRTFSIRSCQDPSDCASFALEDGSLLVMGEGCQDDYEHAILPDPDCRGPRINLTFRKLGWDD